MQKGLKIEDYKKWYSNEALLYELVKPMVGREVSFLSDTINVRGIKAHKVEFLLQNFEVFGFKDKFINIYNSVASLYNMPMFSFNLISRMKQQEEFNKIFNNHVTAFDFVIDMDGKENFKRCYNDTEYLKEVFDNFGVPYSLKTSGTGFHFVIEDKNMPYTNSNISKTSIKSKYSNKEINDNMDYIIRFNKALAERMKFVFGLRSMDILIYDLRRILKAPYSIDYKSGNVAFPLTDEQFKNFDYNDYHVTKLIGTDLKYRGLLFRDGNLGNFNEFMSINNLIDYEYE
jgi:DNA primase